MANGILMPTTSAQVSGHKFLVRRIEHGLVMGDVRMIHDPLSRRRRALMFGLVACVLIAVGSVAMALFRPSVDPGDAPIIRAESGALYVRLDDAVHPVANLASARLIVGEAVEPVAASDAIIGELSRGVPVGLVDAPGIITPGELTPATWLGCQDEASGDIHVAVLAAQPPALAVGEGVLGASTSIDGVKTWHVITASGRAALPPPDSADGRIVRRNLGITATTPTLYLTADLLNSIPEQPPITFPRPLPEVVQDGARSWLRGGDGLAPITALQHGMLIDAGSTTHPVFRPELGNFPESQGIALALPEHLINWVEVADRVVCSDGAGEVAVIDSLPPGVALSGNSVAVSFHSVLHGGVGVDSGYGYYMVSDTGLTHPVADGTSMTALGISDVFEVPWTVLRLLPQGSELSRESALKSMY